MLRLSVIIVSWNVRDLLLNCLRSLREQMQLSPSEWEVIIVDNGSSDGTVEAVRQLEPGAQVIANPDNPGFGRANNQAYRLARGKIVLLLNPDTVIRERAVDRLLAKLEEYPRAGIIGCRLLNPDLTFQRWTGGRLPRHRQVARVAAGGILAGTRAVPSKPYA